jgi:hypothetical protein
MVGDGLNRRELLKRGVIAGGALWATPIMHSVGMAQVDGEDTSPTCRMAVTGFFGVCRTEVGVAEAGVEISFSGCTCAGGVWLVAAGPDWIPEEPVLGSGYAFTLTRPIGDEVTFWLECRDEAGVVIAESNHETVLFGPCPEVQLSVQLVQRCDGSGLASVETVPCSSDCPPGQLRVVVRGPDWELYEGVPRNFCGPWVSFGGLEAGDEVTGWLELRDLTGALIAESARETLIIDPCPA